ncbi:MAG: carbamoyltransferase [Solirubrobacterales bacterium]|jgi:carbamoyltransferase|nr:carbamoyltransferase [Solirubrobacterales bacterium]
MFLGLKTGGHDTAAALVGEDGAVLVAVAEERLDREKHSSAFPRQAIEACLAEAGAEAGDVDGIFVPYRYGHAIWGAGVLPFLRYRGASARGALRLARRLTARRRRAAGVLFELGFRKAPVSLDHHDCHAYAAYLTSPFQGAATLLSVDGRGERASARVYRGSPEGIERLATPGRFPHSVGLLYSAITHHLGFRPNADEGTVMALASYGDAARLEPLFERLLRYEHRRLRTDLGLFAHYRQPEWSPSREFERLGCPPRRPGEPLLDVHADLAAALQKATERVVVAIARDGRELAGADDLCLTGGVALNSVTNGALATGSTPGRVHVPSAPGDDGAALGAALLGWSRSRRGALPQRVRSPFLGAGGAEGASTQLNLRHLSGGWAEELAAGEVALARAAGHLASGAIVGLFDGRAEFGPRALGHRSILADPAHAGVTDRLNETVKFRERFRPFAIAILAERAPALLESEVESPHMSMVFPLPEHARAQLSGVVHVDGTVRIQTVGPEGPPLLRKLLQLFDEMTGVPALVNTSMNVKGEPIVETTKQALACVERTGIDSILIGERLFAKREPALRAPDLHVAGPGIPS